MAAVARLSETDDIHLAACVTPGSVVVPCALAAARLYGGKHLAAAIAAGYAAGISLGNSIGGRQALARGVWPTLFCAPAMAAMTCCVLRRYSKELTIRALTLALSGTAGRIGRPTGSPSGRWYLLAEAVAGGFRAAEAARTGLSGDAGLLESAWFASAAGGEPNIAALMAVDLRPLESTGFKPFVTARQGCNAVVLFRQMLLEGLNPDEVTHVVVRVPNENAEMLRRPTVNGDRLSTISNLGYQMACAAYAPHVLFSSERGPADSVRARFAERVYVEGTGDFDALANVYPAAIKVQTRQGSQSARLIHLSLDGGQPDRRRQLSGKWNAIAATSQAQLCEDVANGPDFQKLDDVWGAMASCLS